MLLRTLPLLALLATTTVAVAQTPQYLFFQAETAIERSQYKYIIEEVMNTDPRAEVFHSDDLTVLQVKSTSGLGEATYREAIQRTGVSLRAGTPDLVALGLTPAVPEGPPVFVVTNDPVADQARYQAEVDRWNAAHPNEPVNATPLHDR